VTAKKIKNSPPIKPWPNPSTTFLSVTFSPLKSKKPKEFKEETLFYTKLSMKKETISTEKSQLKPSLISSTPTQSQPLCLSTTRPLKPSSKNKTQPCSYSLTLKINQPLPKQFSETQPQKLKPIKLFSQSQNQTTVLVTTQDWPSMSVLTSKQPHKSCSSPLEVKQSPNSNLIEISLKKTY